MIMTDHGARALHCSLHYGAQLETSTYQHNTADYVYMYLVGMMGLNVCLQCPHLLLTNADLHLLLDAVHLRLMTNGIIVDKKRLLPVQLLSTFIPFFNLGFNSNSLVFMLCYVWSKNFATTPCSLYGLMTIKVLLGSSCQEQQSGAAPQLPGINANATTMMCCPAGLLPALRLCGLFAADRRQLGGGRPGHLGRPLVSHAQQQPPLTLLDWDGCTLSVLLGLDWMDVDCTCATAPQVLLPEGGAPRGGRRLAAGHASLAVSSLLSDAHCTQLLLCCCSCLFSTVNVSQDRMRLLMGESSGSPAGTGWWRSRALARCR